MEAKLNFQYTKLNSLKYANIREKDCICMFATQKYHEVRVGLIQGMSFSASITTSSTLFVNTPSTIWRFLVWLHIINMASRSNSRLISNSYAHQADRSAAPSNVPQAPRRHQQQQQQHYLHGNMARRAPASSSSLSLASHAPTLARSDSRATASTENAEMDIIIRDERGDYRLDMPSMTPLPRDEARDERGMS